MTEKKRKSLQTAYKKNLSGMFDNITPAIEVLLNETAFLAGHLDELKEDINKEGTVVEYQHGGGQSGVKPNPKVNNYVSFHKSLVSNIKQLIAMAPDKTEKDALKAFMGSRG